MYDLVMYMSAPLAIVFTILTFIDWLSDEKIKLPEYVRSWFLTIALTCAAIWLTAYRLATDYEFAGGFAIFLWVLVAFVFLFRLVFLPWKARQKKRKP